MTQKTQNKSWSLNQTDNYQMVGFKVGGEEFCLNIKRVKEVNRLQEIIKVPKAPDFVEGIMNLRGEVIPVLKLRKRFGYPEGKVDKKNRIMITRDTEQTVGFVVDSVTEVLRIPVTAIDLPPAVVANSDTKCFSGVGKVDDRLLIMVDLDKVL